VREVSEESRVGRVFNGCVDMIAESGISYQESLSLYVRLIVSTLAAGSEDIEDAYMCLFAMFADAVQDLRLAYLVKDKSVS